MATADARILMIGHLDTVLEGEAYRREGERAFGSGVSDMKGGDVVIVEALRALAAEGLLEGRQVIVVLTGDEENPGEPHAASRAALLDAARRSDVALAFEGSVPGAAVVGRRGIGSWRLETSGSTGHSSAIFGPNRGDGAIFEAARILAAFRAELPEPYLTFNPSVIVGGTEAELPVESRLRPGQRQAQRGRRPGDRRGRPPFPLRRAEGARSGAHARDRRPRLPARPRRPSPSHDGMPPMAPTDGNRALLALLDRVSRDLGTGPYVEHDPTQRGAGDISFVAHLLPGLDGLGAMGDQEHAPGEFIELAELPDLVKRAALLVHRLAD